MARQSTQRRPTQNQTALAGEFAVLSQLALRGFDANLTLGNTKNVDILVSDPSSGSLYRIEVKTTTRRNPVRSRLFGYCHQWMMKKQDGEVDDGALFYCFVNLDVADPIGFQFFVVPSRVVASYVRDQHQVWLRDDPLHKDTNMRAFRLAAEPEGHPLPTPMAVNYENNWSFRP